MGGARPHAHPFIMGSAYHVGKQMDSVPPRNSLQSVVGWLAASGLAGLLAISGAFGVYTYRERWDKAAAETAAVTERLAENAARLFDAADYVIKQAGKDTAGMSWNEISASRDVWEDLHDRSLAFPYVENIWLNDADGRLRLTTYTFPAPYNVATDRDFFRASLQPTDKAFISAPVLGRITGKPTFLLARRLTWPDGTMRGIASVTIDPTYFENFFRSVELPYSPRISLIRELDMGVLVRLPGPPVTALEPAPQPVQQAIATAPERGILRDGERLRAYARLDPWPLYVATSIDQQAVVEAWRREMLPFAVTVLLALAALAALSLFGFRQARADRWRQAELERRVRERTSSLQAALYDLSSTLAQKEQLVEQKVLLMREINHRVKNSLGLVASMLSLQALSSDDPDLRRQLDEAGRRVRSVSDVHDMLYRSDDVRTVRFADYVRALSEEMQSSALPPEAGWQVRCDCDPIDLPADQAIPLGLIASELLLNAGKYAYPAEDGAKPVDIRIRHDGECLHMTVADQGVGLPADFDRNRSRSLGMRLITALVGQLEGRLDIDRRGKGVAFTISVPIAAG